MQAYETGLDISPVWNKSNREHMYVGSQPIDTRKEADDAVKALSFEGKYFVDADHINLKTVGPFVEVSDFFSRSTWLPSLEKRASKKILMLSLHRATNILANYRYLALKSLWK